MFYGAAAAEAQAIRGQDVYVAGAGNSAGQAAVHLAKHAASVTILARGATLSDMSHYLVKQIQATPTITVRPRTEVVDGHGTGRLEALTLCDHRSGATQVVPASALFVVIGAEPHTGWLHGSVARDRQGYLLTGPDLERNTATPTGWPLVRPPLFLETSTPGVFAAGDVRHRSVKRVASAVGEGAIAIQLIHEYLAE